MEIPQSFLNDLNVEFQSRLRIRWSGKEQSFLIQQRVGKNMIGSIPRAKLSSEKIQDLAEGYLTIMNVSGTESIKCPECSSTLDVPKMETKQIQCMYCKVKGRPTKFVAGYYPLDSNLINHLKSIDPLRNMDEDQVGRMNEYNERLQENQVKSLSDEAENYASDNLTKLMGIPEFKYGGMKVKEGTDVKGF